MFAWTAIPEGHEITIDYRLNAFGDDTWRCDCRSSNCTGYVVGSFFSLSRAQQRAYLPYAPTYIRNEYRRRLAADACSLP